MPSLPATLRVPVFVVLHLPRERPSLLTEIFQPRCAVSIREPEDKERVEPGVVYVAPPDYHMLVDVGPAIALSADDPVNFSRPSIDVLFESAAEAFQSLVTGVLLTGGNHDGAKGLRRICDSGGRALVQDPATAEMPVMPRAALAECPQAQSLTLLEISKVIQALSGPAAA